LIEKKPTHNYLFLNLVKIVFIGLLLFCLNTVISASDSEAGSLKIKAITEGVKKIALAVKGNFKKTPGTALIPYTGRPPKPTKNKNSKKTLLTGAVVGAGAAALLLSDDGGGSSSSTQGASAGARRGSGQNINVNVNSGDNKACGQKISDSVYQCASFLKPENIKSADPCKIFMQNVSNKKFAECTRDKMSEPDNNDIKDRCDKLEESLSDAKSAYHESCVKMNCNSEYIKKCETSLVSLQASKSSESDSSDSKANKSDGDNGSKTVPQEFIDCPHLRTLNLDELESSYKQQAKERDNGLDKIGELETELAGLTASIRNNKLVFDSKMSELQARNQKLENDFTKNKREVATTNITQEQNLMDSIDDLNINITKAQNALFSQLNQLRKLDRENKKSCWDAAVVFVRAQAKKLVQKKNSSLNSFFKGTGGTIKDTLRRIRNKNYKDCLKGENQARNIADAKETAQQHEREFLRNVKSLEKKIASAEKRLITMKLDNKGKYDDITRRYLIEKQAIATAIKNLNAQAMNLNLQVNLDIKRLNDQILRKKAALQNLDDEAKLKKATIDGKKGDASFTDSITTQEFNQAIFTLQDYEEAQNKLNNEKSCNGDESVSVGSSSHETTK